DGAGVATIGATTAYQPSPRLVEMPGALPTVLTFVKPPDLAALRQRIQALRSNVDLVVASFHWGVSDFQETQDYQQELARAAIDSGADVVIGHHPHMVQRIEVYSGKPIFYSLGNFVFGWERMNRAWTGLLARVHISAERRVESVTASFVRRDDSVTP